MDLIHQIHFNFNKMKTEKISFKNIKDVLSRDEMKGIMAGLVHVALNFPTVKLFAV